MKKYKLLYFVSEDEYFLSHKLEQARSALKNNYKVLVVCKFSNYEKQIQSYGFETKHLEFDRKSINPLRELNCIRKFFNIVKNFKPDILQGIALKPILYISIISSFFKRSKIILCVVGLGYIFINKNITTKIIRFFYISLIKLFLIKKVFFVFQNIEDKRTFNKNNITRYSKTFVIRGSGINTDKYVKTKIKKIYDIIFHSRILYDKGFVELIEAVRNLKKKISLSVLVLGYPDSNNRSSIEVEKLKKWEHEKLIIWKGRKKNVLPFIQRSKMAVLPSYREGLPKTLLEAASCELPIVATNVVGCRDICIDRYNGFLVSSRDVISLENAIAKILKNPKKASLFGKNGRKLVKKEFSSKIVAKKFIEIYQL